MIFRGFSFYPYPQSAQNIETAGVQEGCNKISTANCTLFRLYFVIFQYVAMSDHWKYGTLLANIEGAVQATAGKRGLEIFLQVP